MNRSGQTVKTYTLVFREDDAASPLKIEFDIANPASLFQIAETYVTGRVAELWEGKHYVGEIRRSQNGYWRLTSTSIDI